MAGGAESAPRNDRYGVTTAEVTAVTKPGFFDIYKPGQGYHTRLGTALGGGFLLAWFAYFLWDKLSVLEGETGKYAQIGVPVVVLIGVGLAMYWALALNRKVCDFLIATEGEVKKVNWTSRKEIIGSTKVVIAVLLIMSVLIFCVDVFFMWFFNRIGILKGDLPI